MPLSARSLTDDAELEVQGGRGELCSRHGGGQQRTGAGGVTPVKHEERTRYSGFPSGGVVHGSRTVIPAKVYLVYSMRRGPCTATRCRQEVDGHLDVPGERAARRLGLASSVGTPAD